MVVEKLKSKENFTYSEKLIADYLLDTQNKIENLTSTELGKVSFTSQSAVIRLYKKLGLSTFRQFITLVAIEKKEYLKSLNELTNQPSQTFTSYEATQKTMMNLYQKIINETDFSLNKNNVIRLCNRLTYASSIDIYAIGNASTLAKQLTFQLQTLGKTAIYHHSFNQSYIQNMTEVKSTLSIIVTTSQINEDMMQMIRNLKEHHIYVTTIQVASFGNTMECSDAITAAISYYDDLDIICSHISLEYIIHFIIAILISKMNDTLQLRQHSQISI